MRGACGWRCSAPRPARRRWRWRAGSGWAGPPGPRARNGADRLVAGLQRPLEAGDRIPDGPPGTAWFVVERVDAPHLLVCGRNLPEMSRFHASPRGKVRPGAARPRVPLGAARSRVGPWRGNVVAGAGTHAHGCPSARVAAWPGLTVLWLDQEASVRA